MSITSQTKQDSVSIKDFFENFDLEISEYQRPYVWSGQQIINLYNDLIDFSGNQKDLPDYYLGNIILVKSDKSDKFKIIDGQQRIISLLIIDRLISNKFHSISLDINSKVTADNIKKNAGYLKQHLKQINDKIQINWDRVNITYIIAKNDDQAFKFYTTLSTSGRRLAGIDIIKPFHLQAIEKDKQEEKALQLEKYQFDHNKLANIVKILLRARYWKGIDFKDFPRNHIDEQWKIALENEFVKNTKNRPEDKKYLFGIQSDDLIQIIPPNYKIDQPLNKGLNSINYMLHFAELWDKIIKRINDLKLDIITNVSYLSGTEFNHEYFQAVLLTFVSKFGEATLYEDGFSEQVRLLFKFCYYPRLDVRVTKKTIVGFEQNIKLLNRILVAYDKEEILDYCIKYTDYNLLNSYYDIKKDEFKGRPTLKNLDNYLSIDPNNLTNPFFN